MKNYERADRAFRTVYKGGYAGEDDFGGMLDLITDLRHLADENGIDFDEVLMISERHWSAEAQEEHKAATL